MGRRDVSKQCAAMRAYFDERGIKQTEIAERLQISGGAVSNLLAGRDGMGKNRARMLHDVYGFSMRFLMTGEGELFQIDEEADICPAPAPKKSKLCPSPEELKAQVDALREQLNSSRKENEWLRSLVDRLTPKTSPNSANNLQGE